MTIYAVGDIHGQLDMLRGAYDRIEADRAREGTKDAQVVFVGDYTDRGPDSKGVLDWLIAARDNDAPFVCLTGNHDRMMLGFIDEDYEVDDITKGFDWLRDSLGGRMTLESYEVDIKAWTGRKVIQQRAAEAVPPEHIDFLKSLTPTHSANGIFFTHAGIRPGIPLSQQKEADLLWIRDEFLNDTQGHPALIVHGHTPVRAVEHAGNRVNIDTGAGYGRSLSAVVFEGDKAFELTETGRVPVIHPSDF